MADGTGSGTRFFGYVSGVMLFLDRRGPAFERQAYPFLARSVSNDRALLTCGISAGEGEAVALRFDDIGIRRGHIDRVIDGSFQVALEEHPGSSAAIEARIDWLRKRARREVKDQRSHKRVFPRELVAPLTLGADHRETCRIVDMSSSGVAVIADCRPALRALVGVGAVVGRVVRYLDDGFAIEFLQPVEIHLLQDLLSLKTRTARHIAKEKVSNVA